MDAVHLLDRLTTPINTHDPARLDIALGMLSAALTAADPEAATLRALSASPDHPRRVAVMAIGKAAPAMARGAIEVLGESVDALVIVTDHQEEAPSGAEMLVTSHPVPDASSVAAGRRLLEVAAASEDAIFLISGGGSALAEVPAPGLTLEDLRSTYTVLLREGVPIEEANTVRAHLSALKGGRLAGAARGRVTTVLVSDVIGGAHLVASGPTVPCPTTPIEALSVLERRGLTGSVPEAVLDSLAGAALPPPIPEARVLLAADGAVAARGAIEEAGRRGVPATIVTTALCGEAAEAARQALEQTRAGQVGVLTGETTVEVRGEGRGGRNQEAALTAAQAIEGTSTVFAALGTDGIDGPTDAAGAIVDGSTARRIQDSGLDPLACLADNDSHRALDAAGSLIRCGPTGTNVADIWLVDRR